MPELCAIHEETMNQVRQVLNDEQVAELEQQLQQRESRDSRERRGPGSEQRRDRLERMLESC